MDGGCYCGDQRREWLEKHEREMWRWVEKYESGTTPDLAKIQGYFSKQVECANSEFTTGFDAYVPPEIQAYIMYKGGYHKMGIIEFLTNLSPKKDEKQI